MTREHITTHAHRFIDKVLAKDMIAVDATAGNGYDTLYLAQRAKAVIAFDIQPQAIDATRQRTQGLSNVTLVLDSHANLAKHVQAMDLIVFNLGYLPHGDPAVITQTSSTLDALKAAIPLLKDRGHLLITGYRGHPGGLDETLQAVAYLSAHQDMHVMDAYTYDEPLAPLFMAFQKRG
jgi:tRNA G37 N-methylase Trm5